MQALEMGLGSRDGFLLVTVSSAASQVPLVQLKSADGPTMSREAGVGDWSA